MDPMSPDKLGRPMDVPESALPMFANWKIDHVSLNILPMFKARGITGQQIKTLMIENPKNLFLGK